MFLRSNRSSSSDESPGHISSDWETFPPEPPEAKNWIPNPDSIPKPAKLKPVTNRARKVVCDRVINKSTAGPSSSLKASAAAAGHAVAGTWPPPVPTASDLPENLVSTIKKKTPLCLRADVPEFTMNAKEHMVAGNPVASPEKMFPQPQASKHAAVIGQSEPKEAIAFPAWAVHLEKLLQVEGSERSAVGGEAYTCTTPAVAVRLKFIADTALPDTEREITEEIQEPTLSPVEENHSMETGIEDHESEGASPRGAAHSRWMAIVVVRAMEDDLDITNRASKRELVMMDEAEFYPYFGRVASAHLGWWLAESKGM